MKVWQQVSSEAHICTARHCGPRGNCFFQEARKAAADATMVVVNHTLFFALLNTDEIQPEGSSGFLFPNDFVILDEAHTIEQVAAVQLGLRVSQAGLRFDLQRLYHPRTRKGLLKPFQKAAALKAVEAALAEADRFFDKIGGAAKFGEYSKEFRVRQPELVPNSLAAPLRRSGKKSTRWRRTWKRRQRGPSCWTRHGACARRTARSRCFSIRRMKAASIGSSAAEKMTRNTISTQRRCMWPTVCGRCCLRRGRTSCSQAPRSAWAIRSWGISADGSERKTRVR